LPSGTAAIVDNRQSGPPSHPHPGRCDSVPEIAPVNPALAAMAQRAPGR